MLPLVVGLVVWQVFDQFSRQKDALLAEPSTLSAEQRHAVKQMLESAECQLARRRLKVEQGGPIAAPGPSAIPGCRDRTISASPCSASPINTACSPAACRTEANPPRQPPGRAGAGVRKRHCPISRPQMVSARPMPPPRCCGFSKLSARCGIAAGPPGGNPALALPAAGIAPRHRRQSARPGGARTGTHRNAGGSPRRTGPACFLEPRGDECGFRTR